MQCVWDTSDGVLAQERDSGRFCPRSVTSGRFCQARACREGSGIYDVRVFNVGAFAPRVSRSAGRIFSVVLRRKPYGGNAFRAYRAGGTERQNVSMVQKKCLWRD